LIKSKKKKKIVFKLVFLKGIHEEMIKDFNRTNSYRKAIMSHAAYFKDKVVL
jgi:hypothetical protein